MEASFRDPAGSLMRFSDRVIRCISSDGLKEHEIAKNSPTLREFTKQGKFISGIELEKQSLGELFDELKNKSNILPEEYAVFVEHRRIAFPTYPYEWVPEMLFQAANLTLDLADSLLDENVGLKDASPYNVLFEGAQPVFIDWLSFEQRDELDPTWIPYAQFIRNFVLPLLLNKEFGIELSEIFLSNRDGIEPERVAKIVKGAKKYSSTFLTMVTLPSKLGAKKSTDVSIYEKKRVDSPEKARFIIRRQLKSLRKTIEKLNPSQGRKSIWVDYVGKDQHFSENYLKEKDEFVANCLTEASPETLLDIGCNTGYFSRIAAKAGANVLALDLDSVSIGNVFNLANKDGLDILPLNVDITRPSPGTGWRNEENPSFLDRVYGKFDFVLMLAVIHHMMVSERIPLEEIVRLVSKITANSLIIEFVPPSDKMFQIISRGRDHLFEYLDQDYFEKAVTAEFRIVKQKQLPDSERLIYLLQK